MKNLQLVKHNPAAYTLIEFLIYISLFSFVFILFIGVLNKSWFNILLIKKKQDMALELALAGDVLRRDLLSASMNIKNWCESDFIFKKQFLDSKNVAQDVWVHWYVGNLGLMRAEGQFNTARKTWQSDSISLVSKNVSQIQINLNKDDESGAIMGVRINLFASQREKIKNFYEPYEYYINLRSWILR